MSGDILDQIDGAIDDWSVSQDAMRWTPEPPSPPQRCNPATLAPFIVLDVEEFTFDAESLRRFFANLSERFRPVVAAANSVARQLQDAGMIPEPEPEDPRERALHRQRSRNTGLKMKYGRDGNRSRA